MAFDKDNFVGPAPGGGYVVYVGGKEIGTYPDLNVAQGTFESEKAKIAPVSTRPAPTPVAPFAPNLGAPMSMVGGLDQLSGQQNLMNALYLRRRLEELELPQAQATLSGFMPQAWQRAQRRGTGNYKTKNGTKTLDQMRAEIVAASKA